MFEFGGIRMYLYVQTRVSRLIFRVLDVLKGLGAGPHQRRRLWALKHACSPRIHASLETLILTTLMTQLQTIITHSIKVQIKQNLFYNWSLGCLHSNEINPTQKSFVDQKLWLKQGVKVIFKHHFQSDYSIFELWLLSNYQNNFNYLL